MLILIDIAGWMGGALILGSYLLITAGKVTAHSALYQVMNVVGAAGFIANGWWYGAIPSATLNVIWLAIALYALWRIRRRARAVPAPTRGAAPVQ
ncbi:MAG TPA: hypothetical protein VGB79_15975 [Allosphingosinicella sp.]|jgi:fatty acid desaturase